MSCSIRHILLPLLVMGFGVARAQDITGTWEGSLGNDQYLQLNVIQVKNKICGYTYDYVLADQRSHCKAYFTGDYNKQLKEYILDGESFIENSGSHILMRITLSVSIVNGRTMLLGSEGVAGGSVETVLGNFLQKILGNQMIIDNKTEVRLQKTGSEPRQVLDKMKDCYEQKLKESIPKSTVINKPPTPVVKNLPPIVKTTDTVVKTKPILNIPHFDTSVINIPPPVKKPDNVQIPQQMVTRRNIDEGHVVVNTRSIILDVYDNGIVDGDTVSIFFNGKLLLSHERLSEKPIEIRIELDQKTSRNELILFAENLGSIPPNTALVIVHAGEKRFELFSKASLEENAMLIIDYQPE